MILATARTFKDHLGRTIAGGMPVSNMADDSTYSVTFSVYHGLLVTNNTPVEIVAGNPAQFVVSGLANGWSDLGIVDGDSVTFVFTNYEQDTTISGTFTVLAVDNSALLIPVGIGIGFSAGWGFLFVNKASQAVEANLNLIPSVVASGLNSIIDDTTIRLINSSIGGLAVSATLPLTQIGNKSGAIITSAEVTRLADTNQLGGGLAKNYRITVTYKNWLYLTMFQEDYFEDALTVTPYLKASFFPVYNNFGTSLNLGYKPSTDGNTGFRDENFNQNDITKSITSTIWTTNGGQVIAGFDYSQPTRFEIEVETENTFGANFGLIFFNDVRDIETISAKVDNNYGDYSHAEHTILAEKATFTVASGQVMSSAIGLNGEQLEFDEIEVVVVGTTATISGRITPNSAFSLKFADEDYEEKYFAFLVRTESASFTASNYSDTVNLTAWLDLGAIQPIESEPYTAKEKGFLIHIQEVSEVPAPFLESCTEDDFIFKALFDLDDSVAWEKIAMTVEVERLSDGAKFNLESYEFSFSNVVMVGGVLQLDEILNLPQYLDAPERNKITLKNTGVTGAGNYEVLLLWSEFVNWRYWMSQSNALNDFYDLTLPNNGQSKEWVRYLQLLGFKINVKATLVKDGLGYYMDGELQIQDYDDSLEITTTHEYYDEANVLIPALGSNMLVKIRAIHTLASGAWNLADTWGWIAERGFENEPRKQVSTFWDWTSQNSPLKPKVGETKATMDQPVPGTLHVECLIDTSLINPQNYSIVSRIQSPFIDVCLHPFEVFFNRVMEYSPSFGMTLEEFITFLLDPANKGAKGYSNNMCCSPCPTIYNENPPFTPATDFTAFVFGGHAVINNFYGPTACCIQSYDVVDLDPCNASADFDLSTLNNVIGVVDYTAVPTFFDSVEKNITVINDYSPIDGTKTDSMFILGKMLEIYSPDPVLRFEMLRYLSRKGFVAKCFTDGSKDISLALLPT